MLLNSETNGKRSSSKKLSLNIFNDEQFKMSTFQKSQKVQKKENDKISLLHEKQEIENKLTKLIKYIHKKKQDLKIIIEKLNSYYHGLLIQGIDTRKEGLSWIISAIWSLGQDVILTYLPSFLDEKGIQNLFLFLTNEGFQEKSSH